LISLIIKGKITSIQLENGVLLYWKLRKEKWPEGKAVISLWETGGKYQILKTIRFFLFL
jgi:hypothetical protein